MKTTIREFREVLRSILSEAPKKKKSLGIDRNYIVNPAEGRDDFQVDNMIDFVEFLSNLARSAKPGQKLVYHGDVSSYMIDPNDFLNITASDGSKLPLKYLSDLGKYDRSFSEIVFDMDSDVFPDHVRLSKPVDQEDHETGKIRGDW